MTIRVVTDSTCDLPPQVAAELGIVVIPDFINTADRSYLDGVDITRREFYERLPGWNPPPTTAAPSVDAFKAVYQDLADQGASAIVSMHLGGRLSNLANVARLAAEDFRPVPVTVVEGGFLSLAGGFTATAAGQAARAGQPLEEIVRLIHDQTARTHIFAAPESMEFLRRSGRVSHLRAVLGSWLQICPVLKIHDLEVGIEPVRTRSRAIARVIAMAAELGKLEDLGIVHANVPERAEAFREQISAIIPGGRPTWITDITPVIGVHVGPGTLGLVAVQAK